MARSIVRGTSGKDTLDVRNGFNDVFALAGNDTVRLLSAGDTGGNNFVDAGTGNDGVVNNFEGGNDIRLGDGNDTYLGLGFALGGTGDLVRGGAGDDLIVVQTLLSTYLGDSGDDTFVSTGFRNAFEGGSGLDTISYESRTDDSVAGRTGVEVRLDLGEVFTGNSRFESLLSIENARGSNNADTIVGNDSVNLLEGLGGNDLILGNGGSDSLRGGAGNDELQGGTGSDKLYGESGDDVLFGEAGADRLVGGSGKDSLLGESGNDTLRGGTGVDLLTGGTGLDIFVFNTTAEASSATQAGRRDIIRDFTRGQDRIDLSLIDAKTTVAGDQAFSLRSGEQSAFTGTKGQLIWDKIDSGSAKTIVQGDLNGDKVADFHIQLTGHLTLSSSDFIL